LRVMVSTLHLEELKRMLFCTLQQFRFVNDCCKHLQSSVEVIVLYNLASSAYRAVTAPFCTTSEPRNYNKFASA
jgi:hypothetical protein